MLAGSARLCLPPGAFGGAGLAALAGVLLPEDLLALFIAGAASACVAGVITAKRRPTAD
ncbi:MAG: hypothetical protein JO363_14975 [Solirubrobacterales bacterium]|nr:hypothetical protein [Solirubrobacterales bacterium]